MSPQAGKDGKDKLKWSRVCTVNHPHATAKRSTTENRLSKSAWEPYKDLILHLYYEKNYSLVDVMDIIKEKGFEATTAQYKHALEDWAKGEGGENIAKYLKLSSTQRLQARHQRDGRVKKGKNKHAYKDTKTGKVLDAKKLERILRRNEERDCAIPAAYPPPVSNPIDPEILVFTPSPTPTTTNVAILSVSEQSADINEADTDMDRLSYCVQTSPQSLGTSSNHRTTNSALDMYKTGLQDSFNSSLEEVGGADITVEEPMEAFVPTLSSDTIENVPHGAANASDTTPSFEYIDFIDFGNDLTLAVDLPYFQLQTLLITQGLFSRLASPRPASGEFSRPPSPAIYLELQKDSRPNVSISERSGLLAGILGRPIYDLTTEPSRAFASYLALTVPQQFQGEIESRLNQFFDPSNRRTLQYLFEFAAFYISNDILNQKQLQGFLKWIINQNYLAVFVSFLQNDTATTRALSQNILEAAIAIENMELLRHLFSSGIKFENHLSKAIRIADEAFVKSLLLRVDSSFLSGESGGKLLLDIADTDRVQIGEILVRKGANADFKFRTSSNRIKYTPLIRAVMANSAKMAKFLLQNGVDVNLSSHEYGTPLGAAASQGLDSNYDIVTLLLDHGANVDECSVDGKNLLGSVFWVNEPLYRLIRRRVGNSGVGFTTGSILLEAKKGKDAFCRFLQDNQGEISQHELEKALCVSAVQGHRALWIISILLECGVNPNCTTLPEPPLLLVAMAVACEELAAETGTELFRLLIDAGGNVNFPGLLTWTVAASCEPEVLERLELLFNAGADGIAYGPDALTTAVGQEAVEVVALLLDRGAPINAIAARTIPRDYHRLAPIQVAGLIGNLELMQYLFNRGADINTPAFRLQGLTALQAACVSGRMEVVKFLLENGAEVNARPAISKGYTAMEAVFYDDLICGEATDATSKSNLFSVLLEHGADPSLAGSIPNQVIHHLIRSNFLELLETVLRGYSVDPNVMSPGKEGRTPLQLAAGEGRFDMVKLLVAHGAKVNSPPAYQHGRTALQAATSSLNSNINIVKYLVESGADVNADPGPSGGITAMQGAAIAGCIPIAEFLLEKGARVNEKAGPVHGRTAVEGAAEHGRLDMVQWLIRHGAAGDIVCGMGFKKARTLAEKNGYDQIVTLLDSAERSRKVGAHCV